MRIVLVVPSLRPGGAERVLSILANQWAASHRQVDVLTFAPSGCKPFFELDPAIRYRSLALEKESSNLLSALLNNLKRAWVLGRALRAVNPDVVVSFLTETNVLTLVSSRFMGVPVIVAEHTDPRRCPLAQPWAMLRAVTYGWAHQIVVLTGDAKSFFSRKLQARTRVIPNPIAAARTDDKSEREKLVLGIGRLGDEKGFDLLLQAFSRAGREMTDWRLELVGEGAQRESLERLARELGIANRVRFPGVQADLDRFYRRAGIFALSSRYEGFPMGLCEAMANGCAVIATEYSTGVFDLIEPGRNGIVVQRENVPALTEALRALMSNPERRAELGAAAESVVDRFGIPRIMAMWEDLLPPSGFTREVCPNHE